MMLEVKKNKLFSVKNANGQWALAKYVRMFELSLFEWNLCQIGRLQQARRLNVTRFGEILPLLHNVKWFI